MNNTMTKTPILRLAAGWLLAANLLFGADPVAQADEPAQGTTKQAELGEEVVLELVYIPPGEFMMGSTPAEKRWATSRQWGAQPGTTRESFEGAPRLMRVKEGFWMGRTEVTVGQFRRFIDATRFITDAEKPNGKTQCFNRNWVPVEGGWEPPYPWMPMDDKSWRDPNHGIRQKDHHPVVCVSYNDMKAFCKWLTKVERANGGLPNGTEYRLPSEAEWAYACRGGRRDSSHFWWGNDLKDGKGRLNISGLDFLPGEARSWPRAKVPWSDGFAMVSPVDAYGGRGRNGFGLADMCGGVWEFVLDHFDAKGGHENVFFEDAKLRSVSRPVCRGGNFFDVPGNARCAVRLGIRSVTYSDSRDGFRICLGVPRGDTSAKAIPPRK
ncbi:MAG: formylglycine-generating enzyme family protein [Pirellulaceae bacterium]